MCWNSYEALKLPPLLPEHLQPVQVVVQSTADWQVWVGAGTTLIGAAIGAGLGSVGAYIATNRAHRLHTRRHKIREALLVVGELEQKVQPLVGSMVADADGLTDGGVSRIKETASLIDMTLTGQLNNLLLDCLPGLQNKASHLHILLVGLQSGARQNEYQQRISVDDFFITPGLTFQRLLSEIKSELLKESSGL